MLLNILKSKGHTFIIKKHADGNFVCEFTQYLYLSAHTWKGQRVQYLEP